MGGRCVDRLCGRKGGARKPRRRWRNGWRCCRLRLWDEGLRLYVADPKPVKIGTLGTVTILPQFSPAILPSGGNCRSDPLGKRIRSAEKVVVGLHFSSGCPRHDCGTPPITGRDTLCLHQCSVRLSGSFSANNEARLPKGKNLGDAWNGLRVSFGGNLASP